MRLVLGRTNEYVRATSTEDSISVLSSVRIPDKPKATLFWVTGWKRQVELRHFVQVVLA